MRAAAVLALCLACGPSVVGRAPLTHGGSAAIVRVPLRLSNVYLIETRSPVLVDSGTIGDIDDLETALAERGVSISAVKLVIITHAHADHAGLAAPMQELAHAKIILGSGDVAQAAAGQNDNLKPTGFMGSLLKPFITGVFPELGPDITIDPGSSLDLAPWGIAGKVVAMPGHTPGSLVVLLADHTAFVGDMMANSPLPREHLYQADAVANARNIKTLLDLGVTKFYVGHGAPLERKDVIKP